LDSPPFTALSQHEGFINVHSEPGEGTTFWIYFPATAGKPEQQKAISTGSTPKGNETVLVSDDHDGLRAIAEESLTSYGYKVVLATNGTEAVRIFSQRQNEIQLVILDVTMPLLRGPQAYAQMSELKPNLPVVFTSGHTAESSQLGPLLKNGAAFMQKPYSPKELGRVVRRLIDKTG
jgi:two-component system, cell cycle sensor histidine kinase and response regulator CckA